MALKIETLGEFIVNRDGSPISEKDWKSLKNKNLVKILITQYGHSITKDQLMEWLWPDLNPDAANRNLRVAISQARKALEPDLLRGANSSFISTTDSGYAWNTSSPHSIDSLEFKSACEEFLQRVEDSQLTETIELAEYAKSLYKGGYLEGDRYEDWGIARREELHELYFALLSSMADQLAQSGKYRRAISNCKEILSRDNLRESTCRQLMLYSYLAGDSPGAMRAFETFQQNLAQDLAVEPSESITELYNQIRANLVPEIDLKYQHNVNRTVKTPYSLSPGSIPFVGRNEELTALMGLLDSAMNESGTLAIVSGDAGIGKSRFLSEFQNRLPASLQSGVIRIVTHKIEKEISYSPWSKLIDALIYRFHPIRPIDLQPIWLAEAAKISTRVADLFPDVPQNPMLNSDEQRLRFFKALQEFILYYPKHIERNNPWILVFEDLHWWDYESLQFFNHLLPKCRELPVLFICTMRTGESTNLWATALQNRSKNVHHIQLGRLSASELHSFTSTLPLGETERAVLNEDFHSRAAGNPLFIISALQGLFETGALVVEDSQWVANQNNGRELLANANLTPESVQEAISLRLEALAQDDRELLQLASVIGTDWDLNLIQQSLGENSSALQRTVNLIDAQLITEQGSQYEFSHPLIREVILMAMPTTLREVLNRKVLHAYEKTYSDRLELIANKLAQYAYDAGDMERARIYAKQAVRRAESSFQMNEVIKMSDLGLLASDEMSDPHERAQIQIDFLRSSAAAWDALGNRTAQFETYERALKISKKFKSELECAEFHKSLGEYHNLTSEFDLAMEHLQNAIHLYRKQNDKVGVGLSLISIGEVEHRRGQLKEALASLEQASIDLKEAGNEAGLAESLLAMGNINFFSLAKYNDALAQFNEALKIFELLRDLPRQARALNNLGNVYFYALSKSNLALENYQQALQVFRAVGDRYGEGMALNNIGNVYRDLRMGKIDEARDYLHQSIEACRETSDDVGEAISYSNLGRIELSLGNYDKAQAFFDETIRICDRIALPSEKAGAFYYKAFVALEQSNFETAESLIQVATAIYTDIGDERALGNCPAALGEIYFQSGQLDKAIDLFKRAASVESKLELASEASQTQAWLALAYRKIGELGAAQSHLKRAVDIMSALENPESPQLIYFAQYVIERAKNLDKEAAKHLKLAQDAIYNISEKLTDSDDRSRFLRNIRLNREILDTAKASL